MSREEIANSISHGFGLVMAIVALPFLVLSAMRAGDVRFLIGVSVFGATMVLLYLASTLYHSTTHEAAKQLFRLFDHTAIFLLIAGSYTPFALGVLRGPWGWSMLAAVWTLAIVGITLKIIERTRHSRISIVLYLLMGWLAVVAVKPILLACTGPRDSPHTRRRHRLHRRPRILRRPPHKVQPLHLAPLRDRRNDLSLLRCALVRSVRFSLRPSAYLCPSAFKIVLTQRTQRYAEGRRVNYFDLYGT